MNNFNYPVVRSSIDMTDVSSVKEMIFNRAREKSASIAAEKEADMAASVQNDVMLEAHASISGSRIKPFGGLTQNARPAVEKAPADDIVPDIEVLPLKHNVESVDNSKYTKSMRDDVMNAARTQYSKRVSLMESLNFLNTQAAIRMVNKTHSKIV